MYDALGPPHFLYLISSVCPLEFSKGIIKTCGLGVSSELSPRMLLNICAKRGKCRL